LRSLQKRLRRYPDNAVPLLLHENTYSISLDGYQNEMTESLMVGTFRAGVMYSKLNLGICNPSTPYAFNYVRNQLLLTVFSSTTISHLFYLSHILSRIHPMSHPQTQRSVSSHSRLRRPSFQTIPKTRQSPLSSKPRRIHSSTMILNQTLKAHCYSNWNISRNGLRRHSAVPWRNFAKPISERPINENRLRKH
jgi:hypothetical protein